MKVFYSSKIGQTYEQKVLRSVKILVNLSMWGMKRDARLEKQVLLCHMLGKWLMLGLNTFQTLVLVRSHNYLFKTRQKFKMYQ